MIFLILQTPTMMVAETARTLEVAKVRQASIANEILMYFRAQKKLAGTVSLSDALDSDPEGGSLSIMDVIRVDDDMLEKLDARDACARVRLCVDRCLDEREKEIIILRYGLDDKPPRTQREIAALKGISRSYVSRLEKKALEKLKEELEK